MITDQDAEACKQCTLKHLSTALVTLTDDDTPDILKKVYFCGNLSHAANHFVKLNEKVAEDIRALRIDAQDDGLNFILETDQIKTRLLAIIEGVTAYTYTAPQPPAARKAPATPVVPVQKRGCPCHGHR